jgi:hypothetical protein
MQGPCLKPPHFVHLCSEEPLQGWKVHDGVRFAVDAAAPDQAPLTLRAGTCVLIQMSAPQQLAVARVEQVLEVPDLAPRLFWLSLLPLMTLMKHAHAGKFPFDAPVSRD